jgi:hypothetical protein
MAELVEIVRVPHSAEGVLDYRCAAIPISLDYPIEISVRHLMQAEVERAAAGIITQLKAHNGEVIPNFRAQHHIVGTGHPYFPFLYARQPNVDQPRSGAARTFQA